MTSRPLAIAVISALFLAAGCSSGSEETDALDSGPSESTADNETSPDAPADDEAAAAAGIRLVSATDGAAIQADPADDLVILDVRTPEEFDEGHLEGAVMIDFYDEDFADQLAELDPNVPYLLYCRSGNRSGQTAAIMNDLGFTDVADVDGGVVAWADAGFSLVGG